MTCKYDGWWEWPAILRDDGEVQFVGPNESVYVKISYGSTYACECKVCAKYPIDTNYGDDICLRDKLDHQHLVLERMLAAARKHGDKR